MAERAPERCFAARPMEESEQVAAAAPECRHNQYAEIEGAKEIGMSRNAYWRPTHTYAAGQNTSGKL